MENLMTAVVVILALMIAGFAQFFTSATAQLGGGSTSLLDAVGNLVFLAVLGAALASIVKTLLS